MNDPHVERLHYIIKHDQCVNYEKAPALVRETVLFVARIENDRAVLEMKQHFAREEDASAAVGPLLLAWQVWAGLQRGPGGFEFWYERCDLVDRRPDPGQLSAAGLKGSAPILGRPLLVQHWKSYPDPPDRFLVSKHVALMYDRYKQYCEGKERLGAFVNFIYTAIKKGSRGQQTKVAKRLGIDNQVLMKMNVLCATRGGPTDARKYEGVVADFTGEERRWLEEVVKVIIRRVGEVEVDPARNQLHIAMKDLPELGQTASRPQESGTPLRGI